MPNAKDARDKVKSRFLLLGDTGSGKTTQILTLPGKKFMYLFDSNAILSLQGFDVDYEEFLPDNLNLSVRSLAKAAGGDKVTNYKNETYREWEEDFENRIKNGFFDDYDVIGLDSMTTFLDLIMDRVLTINGRAGTVPQQDDYGPQMLTFNNVCRTLVSMGKTVFMTGHMETKQDEATKRIFRTPMITGRLKIKIPLLFSDIFVCEAENDGNGNVKHKIQTVPDRMTTCVRTAFRDLNGFEDVTINWDKDPIGQGIGRFLSENR
jgi:AAA domain